jgi:capsular polysaccharide biosynthesis protein
MTRTVLAALGRRWWVVVLCVVVASAAAYGAGKLRTRSYEAKAVLVVPATGPGPGKADEASRLATTYAALIPQDQRLLRYIGARFGLTAKQAGQHVTATTDTTTALVFVQYRAQRPDVARRGALVIAGALTGPHPVTPNIAPHSLSIVHLPTHATTSQGIMTIVTLGAILGLFVGIILLVALERADPRVDDEHVLSEHAGCPVTLVSKLSNEAAMAVVERWRQLSHARHPRAAAARARRAGDRAPRLRPTIALVPISSRAERALPALAQFFDGVAHPDRIHLLTCPPVRDANGAAATSLAEAEAVVLVARRGEALSDLTATLQTLLAFGAAPMWALLVADPPTGAAPAATEAARRDDDRASAAPRPDWREARERRLSRTRD